MRLGNTALVAILVIALLATPLALLARSTSQDPTKCCGTYCPMRNAHSSQHKMMCGSFSAEDRNCGCAMRSNQQPDYGLNTLMAPTMVSAIVRINAPNSSRRASALDVDLNLPAFVAAPFHPPRS